MKPISPLILFTFACLASSCSKHSSGAAASAPTAAAGPVANYCLPASTVWSEEEYTQWMTRAELQFFQEQLAAGQYFAHVEGRNNAGLCEYRAVRKPLPVEQYVEAAVFWGLGDKDVFDTELRLLRAGFVRKSMQVFVDASGQALHQLVWLQAVGTQPTPPTQVAATSPPVLPPTEEPAAIEHPAPPPPPAATEAAPDAPVPNEKSPSAIVVVPTDARPAADHVVANPKKFTIYTVVQGDVVEKIAHRYHTTAEAILAANDLKNDSLRIGQKLKIPKK
ncbi:MAG: LysM peptidoglycan-binding domain-containing protein [Verrucomicrobia bacterium]|nr:MAG: LysM peptidoglycan-binding domain-containing protein [Verrucomicrobiota bacterium]